MTGTVKFFNESKGYGFITNDDTGRDIFVHATALDGLQLHQGDKVEYKETEGRKGMVASIWGGLRGCHCRVSVTDPCRGGHR